MELLISGITLAILRNLRASGYSLMMREFGNLIQMILRLNVLEVSTGGGKVKVLIF